MTPGFQDLLGQVDVVAPLFAAAAQQRLHHCLLFEGPPGVGKRTAALRLAAAAACTAVDAPPVPSFFGPPKAPEIPCGECRNCRQFEAGTHPDLIIVEPAADRKTKVITVDQARELIEKVRLRRYSARWRTVIIDPVDAMNPQAANALLKTLEEPPEGTGFILVTGRVSSLLPTVLSRSQRVRFRAVPEELLVPWLTRRGHPEPLRAARASLGCPGLALALDAEGLAARAAQRAAIVDALSGGFSEISAAADKLGRGRESVEATLDALEGLLRDAALAVNGREKGLLEPADAPRARAWGAALWPTGFERLQLHLDQARQQQTVNVSGRTLLESLFTALKEELGSTL